MLHVALACSGPAVAWNPRSEGKHLEFDLAAQAHKRFTQPRAAMAESLFECLNEVQRHYEALGRQVEVGLVQMHNPRHAGSSATLFHPAQAVACA
jgi:hypothetical protein